MNIKYQLRRLEIPLIVSYFILCFIIYLASRLTFEMTEIKSTSGLIKWVAILVSPFAMYAAFRTASVEKYKWYGYVGFFLIYGALLTFLTQYMVAQSNLLWDAAVSEERDTSVNITEVRKVFKRRQGFDHTEVTLLLEGKPMKMEARPYAFFYLRDKKQLDVKMGHSAMGVYVTSVSSTFVDKTVARWLHLKDMAYRMRWLFGIIILIIVASIIKTFYFPELPGREKRQLSFWKQIGIVMSILFGISLLFYAGLWIYVSFFAR